MVLRRNHAAEVRAEVADLVGNILPTSSAGFGSSVEQEDDTIVITAAVPWANLHSTHAAIVRTLGGRHVKYSIVVVPI